MKFHLTTKHGVLLIAAVNLSVAVASVAIHTFVKLDPYCRTPEAVFSLVTFPVLTIAGSESACGSIFFWTGSVWATPVFYVLMVLNAYIWGVVGVYLFGWFHRTFWIRPERIIPDDEADLKGDSFLVVFTHTVLLLILSGLVTFLVPMPFQLLGGMGGPLPLSAYWLLRTGMWLEHPIVVFPLMIGFLLADGRIYSWLCRSRGKRVGTIWAIGVTTAIVVAIVWYATLTLVFLNSVIQWKLK